MKCFILAIFFLLSISPAYSAGPVIPPPVLQRDNNSIQLPKIIITPQEITHRYDVKMYDALVKNGDLAGLKKYAINIVRDYIEDYWEIYAKKRGIDISMTPDVRTANTLAIEMSKRTSLSEFSPNGVAAENLLHSYLVGSTDILERKPERIIFNQKLTKLLNNSDQVTPSLNSDKLVDKILSLNNKIEELTATVGHLNEASIKQAQQTKYFYLGFAILGCLVLVIGFSAKRN